MDQLSIGYEIYRYAPTAIAIDAGHRKTHHSKSLNIFLLFIALNAQSICKQQQKS